MTTWCTAIFPYKPNPVSTATYDFLPQKVDRWASGPILVDGSCYWEKWRPLRSAASYVFSPGDAFEFASPLPDKYHSSDRAEIYAIILAFFAGPLTIFSDCAEIVRVAQLMKSPNFSFQSFQNCDLWLQFYQLVQNRIDTIEVRKVRAHIRQGDFSQDPSVTKCNDVADELAKAAAHGLFQERVQVLMLLLVSAVELQTGIPGTCPCHSQLPKLSCWRGR